MKNVSFIHIDQTANQTYTKIHGIPVIFRIFKICSLKNLFLKGFQRVN